MSAHSPQTRMMRRGAVQSAVPLCSPGYRCGCRTSRLMLTPQCGQTGEKGSVLTAGPDHIETVFHRSFWPQLAQRIPRSTVAQRAHPTKAKVIPRPRWASLSKWASAKDVAKPPAKKIPTRRMSSCRVVMWRDRPRAQRVTQTNSKSHVQTPLVATASSV
jgi:hypothetical protein